MSSVLFSLVNAGSRDEIVAWGVEVPAGEEVDAAEADTAEEKRAAVVFRPASGSEKQMFSVHDSAEAACRLYSRFAPMVLVWDADYWFEAFGVVGQTGHSSNSTQRPSSA